MAACNMISGRVWELKDEIHPSTILAYMTKSDWVSQCTKFYPDYEADYFRQEYKKQKLYNINNENKPLVEFEIPFNSESK